jgi:hypothetical protein
MPMIRRQIVAQVTIGNTIVRDFLALRASHSLTDPVARATIVAPFAYGTYDDPVEILCGARPGNGPVRRFKGRRRTAHFDLYPRACVMDCVGELSRAEEYINWEEGQFASSSGGGVIPGWNYGNTTYVLGWGGLRIPDIVPESGYFDGQGATFKQIAEKVLTKANVPFNPANIECTGRVYGPGVADQAGTRFIWHSGTGGISAGGDVNVENSYRRAGESALSYLQKYSQIEAVFDLGPGPGPGMAPNKIGFYRLFELPSGEVVIKRVGGRPGGELDYDPYSGRMLVFTEGGSAEIVNEAGEPFPPAPGTPNMLSASFQRGRPLGNRTLVIGTQINAFQMHYEASVNLPFMPIDTYHYDSSPPSSDWIDWMELGGPLGYMERSVSAKLAAPAGTADGSITPDTMANFPEPPFVVRCAQTGEQMLVTDIAGSSWTVERGLNGTIPRDMRAGFFLAGPPRMLPPEQRFGMDCETVAKARLMEIAREVVSGQLTTCDDALLQPGQVHLVQGPAGIADRLRTGEPLWCQGNDFELEIRDGAPYISQTPTYLGGGLEILPPGVAPITAVFSDTRRRVPMRVRLS